MPKSKESKSAPEPGAETLSLAPHSFTTPSHPQSPMPPLAAGQPADNPSPPIANGGSAIELSEKIKELLRLAQEQGYLTYNDINDALPDNIVSPEELDEIYIKLRNLDVEIVDQAEVDRVKQPEPEEEEDKTRLDILDDPVRM